MPVIEVEHLHKQYRDQVAVDDLSFTVERGEIFGVLEAGATGYLLKDAPREELIRAVRAAFAGEAVLSPAVASRLMGQVRKPPPEVLSQRELEVLALIADGTTNCQALRQRGHRQDPPAAHLRETGRARPGRRRRRGLPAPPPHLTARPWTYSSWRRIQVWKPSSSSRPLGARSRMG
jgi:hypothetical protein